MGLWQNVGRLSWRVVVLGALAIVVLWLAGVLAVLHYRNGGRFPWQEPAGLGEFQRLNPQLVVEEEIVPDPAMAPGKMQRLMLWRISEGAGPGAEPAPAAAASTAVRRRALLRHDFVLGRAVQWTECTPRMPVAPGLVEVQCLVTGPTAPAGSPPVVLPGATWLTGTLEGGGGRYEALTDFYAEAGQRDATVSFATHHLGAGRVAVMRVEGLLR